MASRGFLFAILFLSLFVVSSTFALKVESQEKFSSSSTSSFSYPVLKQIFAKWKQRHEKEYATPEEEALRFETFRQNFLFIRRHNRGFSTYRMGLNAFSDLSSQEFRKLMNGYNSTLAAPFFSSSSSLSSSSVSLPPSIDWRDQGAVTGVKNQGQCGGCWSFSATGAIEGQWAISGNSLVGLSEQNLLDCSTNGGNDGCNGGLMTAAFSYVISNNGIDTESSYPYQAEGPLQCRYSSSSRGATIGSFKTVTSGSEDELQVAVATVGPVSVAIDASHSSFQSYSGGVYYEPQCSSTNLDHGVLVVGYGTDSSSGEDYWIVKNSWGTSWGISGYIWMARNRNNNCGIATQPSYPLVSGSGSGGSGGSSSGYYSSGELGKGEGLYYTTGYPTTVSTNFSGRKAK